MILSKILKEKLQCFQVLSINVNRPQTNS